ncbi:MAG TPA: hypothetical protein VL334_21430 [Anaerolineae bacterium]|nr:hypothetical protein [Anaerolineae bacterium]
MQTTRPDTTLPEDVLGQLQGAMLQGILTSSPLPGQSRPLDLPDLPELLNQPAVILSTENLGGPIHLQDPTKPVYILSEEAIQVRAQDEGSFLYLQFQPPQSVAGGVLLTVAIQVAQGERGLPSLGMSGLQVTFQRKGTGWQATDETAAFAA